MLPSVQSVHPGEGLTARVPSACRMDDTLSRRREGKRGRERGQAVTWKGRSRGGMKGGEAPRIVESVI